MPRNVKPIKTIGKLLSSQMTYLQVNIKKLLTVSDKKTHRNFKIILNK